MAQLHGLSKSVRQRLSVTDKDHYAKRVMEALKGDPVMESSVYPCFRDAVYQDPLPYAQMLSIKLIPVKSTKVKSFVDHKRSQGKGSFVR